MARMEPTTGTWLNQQQKQQNVTTPSNSTFTAGSPPAQSSSISTNPFLAGAAREAAAAAASGAASVGVERCRSVSGALVSEGSSAGLRGASGGVGGAVAPDNSVLGLRRGSLQNVGPKVGAPPVAVTLGAGAGGTLASNPFIAQDAAQREKSSADLGGGSRPASMQAGRGGGVKDIARAFDVLSSGAGGAAGGAPEINTTRAAVPTGRNFPGWVTFEDAGSPALSGSPALTPATATPQSAIAPSPAIPTPIQSQPTTPARPVSMRPPTLHPVSNAAQSPQVSIPALAPPNTSSPLSKSPKGSPRRAPPPPPSRSAASSPMATIPLNDTKPQSTSLTSLNRIDSQHRSLIRMPSDPFGDELDTGRSGNSSDDDLMNDDDSERLSSTKSGSFSSLWSHRQSSHGASLSNLNSISGLSSGGKHAPLVPSRPPKPHSHTTTTPASAHPPPVTKSHSVAAVPAPPVSQKPPMVATKSQTIPLAQQPLPPPIPERPQNRSTNPFLDIPSPDRSPPGSVTLTPAYSQSAILSGAQSVDTGRKPPLPPRPITPDANDILAIPRRPSANSATIYDTLTQQTQPPPIPTRPSHHADDNSTIPPTLHDEFVPLSDTRLTNLRMREKIHTPDLGLVNRRPPVAEGIANNELYHKGSLRCFCVSGYYVVTSSGSSTIRVWYTPSGENMRTMNAEEGSSSSSTKVYAMSFIPARYLEDEGRLVWVSVEKGEVLEIDIMNGTMTDRRVVHSGTVTHILKYRERVWTVDENGGLKIWSPGGEDNAGVDGGGIGATGWVSLKSRPKSLRISSGVKSCCVAFERLWYCVGGGSRAIEVCCPGEDGTQKRFDAGNNCGSVVCFAEGREQGVVVSGHDDGKIVVWDGERVGVKRRVVN
ncbi:hypothetical protein HK097_007521, partial [Rhizophlyctis rosea]